MTREERLAKVEELLAQRSAINAALLDLMGAEEAGSRKPEAEPSFTEAEIFPTRRNKKADAIAARKKQYKCSACGKPGHRAKTCSQKAAVADDEPRSGAMPRRLYDRVKLATQHGVPADAIARELELKLKEVNDAIVSSDYESYCR